MTSQQQQLPFAQGDRVSFKTVHYEGTGRVVGMTPFVGFGNYGVVIEYSAFSAISLSPTNPFVQFSCIVVPLYDGFDHAMGFDTPPCVVRLTQ